MSPSESSSSSGSFTFVKIAVIVVALLGAGYFTVRSTLNREEKQPDDAAAATPYICREDGTILKLTAAQYQKLANEGGIKQQSGGGTSDRGGGGELLVRCPKCQQFTCVMAMACPNGTFVPYRAKDGTPGECPK